MQRRLNCWIAALSILLLILPFALAAGFSIYTYQSQNYLMNPWFVPEIPYTGEPFERPCQIRAYLSERYDMPTQFGSVREYYPEKANVGHVVVYCTDWKIAAEVKGIVRAANRVRGMDCPIHGKCVIDFAIAKYSQQELMGYYDRLENDLPEDIRKQITYFRIDSYMEAQPRNSILVYTEYFVTPEIRKAIEDLVPADAVEYLLGTPPLVQI